MVVIKLRGSSIVFSLIYSKKVNSTDVVDFKSFVCSYLTNPKCPIGFIFFLVGSRWLISSFTVLCAITNTDLAITTSMVGGGGLEV